MDDVQVLTAALPEERQQLVAEISHDAFEKYDHENDIAAYIKKNIEARDSPTWQCIVGSSFGSYVAHSGDNFIHLKVRATVREKSGWFYVLLFKA